MEEVMTRVILSAVLGFTVAFGGSATLTHQQTSEAEQVAPLNCYEECGGGAYIIVNKQCVCM
jgi:hypothetical protein